MTRRLALLLTLALAPLVGCSSSATHSKTATTSTPAEKSDAPLGDAGAAERAKLSAADRELVEAQEWCAVMSNERLGEMGPPIKLDVAGKPVFVCCVSCEKKVKAKPEATLAKVEELKAKKLAESKK